jgi:ketosteroid isomerase-like protein
MASIAYDKALALDSKNATAQTKLALIKDMMGGNTPRNPVATTRPTIAVVPAKPIAKPAEPKVIAAPAKPADPKPAVSDKPATAGIEAVIANWAQAWSKRDVDGYLAAYASDFAADGMTRDNWEAQRRARITAPKQIDVQISDLKIEQDSDTASATFRQAYRSDRLKSTVTKTLKLAQKNGQWRIVGETSQ